MLEGFDVLLEFREVCAIVVLLIVSSYLELVVCGPVRGCSVEGQMAVEKGVGN